MPGKPSCRQICFIFDVFNFFVPPLFLFWLFADTRVRELRHWPAAHCNLVNMTVASCADVAKSHRVEDCRGYCVEMLVEQDHFTRWPAVPLERNDTCVFEERRDADAWVARKEHEAKTFDCFVAPSARESDSKFDGKVWLENGGVTSAAKRRWKKAQIALAFFGLLAYWVLIPCCSIHFSDDHRRSRPRQQSVPQLPQRVAQLQQSIAQLRCALQHSIHLQETQEQSLDTPLPLANRFADTRVLIERRGDVPSLTGAHIEELVAGMRSPESGSESQHTCSVCLEDDCENGRRGVLLPSCGHYFHTSCITDWLNFGDRGCPVCREDFVGPLLGT